MEIGLKHLFIAYGLVWVLLFGYLLNLVRRQKRLADELRALKETLSRKSSE